MRPEWKAGQKHYEDFKSTFEMYPTSSTVVKYTLQKVLMVLTLGTVSRTQSAQKQHRETEEVSLDMGPPGFWILLCLDGTVSLASTPHTTAPGSCPQKHRGGQLVSVSEIQSPWCKLNLFHSFPLPHYRKYKPLSMTPHLAPPPSPSPLCPVSSHMRVPSFLKHCSLLAAGLLNERSVLHDWNTLSPTPPAISQEAWLDPLAAVSSAAQALS